MLDITHLFMDFDGVLTDNFVYINENGKESVKCSRADGLGLDKIKEIGIIPVIISSERNGVVGKRAKKLKVAFSGGLKDKVLAMRTFCDDLSKAAFIGNDFNDFDALCAVGYPFLVQDADQQLKIALWDKGIYPKITRKMGGSGAVREVCEMILEEE